MKAIDHDTGGLYFLDAPGGTGKTFIMSLILANVRSRNDLAMASSEIAATLLDGGRTAHSALKLPLHLQFAETPTCNISQNSIMGKVLQKCKIIIWDEYTMAHKKALEALNRTMQGIRGNQELLGGGLIPLTGDFRQTLPVIPRSTPTDELNACIKTWSLWPHVKKFSLTTDMRVHLQNDPSAKPFSKQLLDTGDGKIRIGVNTMCIALPPEFCFLTNSKHELFKKVFPDIVTNLQNHNWLSERPIIAAKNTFVNEININIQNNVTGEVVTYKSIVKETEEEN